MVPSRSASMPRPVSRTVNWTKFLDLFGGQQNLSLGAAYSGRHSTAGCPGWSAPRAGRPAQRRDRRRPRPRRGCASGRPRRRNGRGPRSGAASGRRRSSVNSRRPASSSATSIRSPIRSSSFSLSLPASATSSACKREQLPGKSLSQSVEAPAQLEQRVAQLAAGHADELRLEAVGILQAGDVFKSGHGAQQPPFGVAHGRGAQAVAALLLADAHGQQGGFALGGYGFLHGDGVADGA